MSKGVNIVSELCHQCYIMFWTILVVNTQLELVANTQLELVANTQLELVANELVYHHAMCTMQ